MTSTHCLKINPKVAVYSFYNFTSGARSKTRKEIVCVFLYKNGVHFGKSQLLNDTLANQNKNVRKFEYRF